MKKYSCGNIVDLSDAEIMEIKEKQQIEINVDLTPEERLAIMEDAFAELCEVIFNG